MLRELCFNLALVDDSAMHLALAGEALYTGQPRKQLLQENDRSLGHYTTSVGLVNKQIEKCNTIVCNGLIGAVIHLASYDARYPRAEA